jgi:hypothetical protein
LLRRSTLPACRVPLHQRRAAYAIAHHQRASQSVSRCVRPRHEIGNRSIGLLSTPTLRRRASDRPVVSSDSRTRACSSACDRDGARCTLSRRLRHRRPPATMLAHDRLGARARLVEFTCVLSVARRQDHPSELGPGSCSSWSFTGRSRLGRQRCCGSRSALSGTVAACANLGPRARTTRSAAARGPTASIATHPVAPRRRLVEA